MSRLVPCPVCGRENLPDAEYCRSCLAALKPTSKKCVWDAVPQKEPEHRQMVTQRVIESRDQRGWLRRHWKWFIPLVSLPPAFALVVLFVLTTIKSSDVYTEALARAKSHPSVEALLGKPVVPGFLVTGTINVSGPSGDAELAIPLRGPKGKGTLYVEAVKSMGQWRFTKLVIQGDDGRLPFDAKAK